MSANIPLELQTNIINRVFSVKSLLQFRSVSKQWKSLIDSSEFITHHPLTLAHPHRLLVTYEVDYEINYVLIADDDSFPDHKLSPILPPTVKLLRFVSVLDCSHGLVCLRGYTHDPVIKLIVVWNPLIMKSVGIRIPMGTDDVIGFGVCPKTRDPKIVKINEAKAEVFKLSSGAWRSVSMNMPFRSLQFLFTQVIIDGVIHWIAYDVVTDSHRIYSFDLTSEEFGEAVDLPSYLAACSRRQYTISKFNESLVVLSYYVTVDNYKRKPFCDVWMMLKNGVPKSSFIKLFTIEDAEVHSINGFRKNGQPIMVLKSHGRDEGFELHESCSEGVNGLGIYGATFRTTSYTASLLLVNHYDSIIQ